MSSSLPTRLFKLNAPVVRHAQESFDLENDSLGEIITGTDISKLKSCNYCAISHVWGKKPPSFPVKGIPWPVPISSKEKLIFMLKACERRGYEYVWIDVLCIDQVRDHHEAEKEMPKMQQYYKNAHATIVFGSNWRDFASQWAKVEARIKDWNGDWDMGISVHWDGFADIDMFINDDWFWRVWTLQETVIPLTTTPLDTVVTLPAPYNRARLLTSDGSPMDIRGLCDLIDWTYSALGKLDYTTVVGTHSWIHPGAGMVNDHGAWWKMAILNEAIGLGAGPLHPIQAMLLTRYRNASNSIDQLKGVYALIDPVWYSQTTDPQVLYNELADAYIHQKEGALLLTMAVNQQQKQTKTWAAAAFPESNFGSVVPKARKYPLISATVTDNTLSLKAAGSNSNITVHGTKAYGDGSGELMTLIEDLSNLPSSYDISSIVTLIKSAIVRSRIDLHGLALDSIHDIQSLVGASLSIANAVSNALRGIFSGWDRWIFVMNTNIAILAWLPSKSSAPSSNYSLLWISKDVKNEWAVIVEGDTQTGCKKVGIAFVNSNPVGSETDVKIL
ncbi:hypothetical protein BYT27DRAFT_7200317 [Phlegmacium glaucopus]|nr:hypothetical protein BYT27DRAFT_7200317 [Phlegmacium glaucopus]